MSDYWSPASGLENDPSPDLSSFDFTQQDPNPLMSTQTPNIESRAEEAHAPRPQQTLAFPVELAQMMEETGRQTALNDSTQQPQHPPQAFPVQYQPLGSFSSQPHRPSVDRRTTSQSHSGPIRRNDNPQRFSPYERGSSGVQTNTRDRSGTPASPRGPVHLSPPRQRGSTKSPSARPSTSGPNHSPPSQPLFMGPNAMTQHNPEVQQLALPQEPVRRSPTSPPGGRQSTAVPQPGSPRSHARQNAHVPNLTLQAHEHALGDRLYRDELTRYTSQHGIRSQDLHPDLLASLKDRAFSRARLMVQHAAAQRHAGSMQQPSQPQQYTQMLPPATPQPSTLLGHAPTFDGQNSPEPAAPNPQEGRSEDGRGQSPSSSHHIAQGGALADEAEGSLQASSQLTGSGRPGSGQASTPGDTSTEVPHTNRFQILEGLLLIAIKTANNAYANRASAYEKFQRYYPQLQQNVMNSTYALMAGTIGIDQLATLIWTAGDEQLLLLVRRVSLRVKSSLPTLQKSIANVLGDILDLELRWTATSRSLEMFYNSFSSLKACLKTRDEKRGNDQQILVNALALDRAHVWKALIPASDDDLDGSLAVEQAVYQAQRVENQMVSQREWEAMQAQGV